MLYLLGGCWGETRLLPEGWAEYASTISAAEEELGGSKCEPLHELLRILPPLFNSSLIVHMISNSWHVRQTRRRGALVD